MKGFVVLCVMAFVSVACVATPVLAHRIEGCHVHGEHNMFRGENVNVDLENGSIIFTDQDSEETVEITKEYELLVNDRSVRLGRDEQKLVEDYYETFETIVEGAKELGLEGARIGAQGAKLGVLAVLGVIKLLDEDYDEEDLEADLNHKGEKIERQAAQLEKKGDKLERKADRLQELHESLRSQVSELDDLGWF